MNHYEHTQTGTLMWSILECGAAIFGGIGFLKMLNDPAAGLIPFAVALIFLVCAVIFHSLTVTVSQDQITIKFGVGLIRKGFAVVDIHEAVIVRNRWYYGWAIKWIPHGWLFNVSGFDAVEIQLKKGRRYRIGTDEPTELLSAINSVIAPTT